jgi:hypothetical protein
MTFGIIGAAGSKYNVDYQNWLGWIGLAGLFGGLIGLAVNGIINISTKSKYEFHKLSQLEKMDALQNIMGQ